jgi:putative FmdB family regulatory protein
MPIYEYRCGACGHHLEALQKMTEGPLRKCPECGKSQLKRLVSASRFRLKGSGWYETDFKNKNETQRNLVEKGGAEPSEATGDKSADATAKDATGEAAATGKAVAEAKGDAAAEKPAKPKAPANAATRKSAGKRRAKAAGR